MTRVNLNTGVEYLYDTGTLQRQDRGTKSSGTSRCFRASSPSMATTEDSHHPLSFHLNVPL